MLIDADINRLCALGRLFRVESVEWRDSQERSVYVSRGLNQFLLEQSIDPTTNAGRRRLQRLFDRFISGQMISVAFRQSLKGSDMKRLSPKTEEVWEFKVRGRAKLQLRVFGKFAQKDVFVALTGPVDRQDCDYKAEIVRCQQEWNRLLPGQSPVYGSTIDDYISAKRISL